MAGFLPGRRAIGTGLACVLLLMAIAPGAAAQETYPPRPAEGTFVLDQADMVGASDEAEIREISSRLLREEGIPLWVVTIPTLRGMGVHDGNLDRYARALFDAWGLGSLEDNRGVLLVIARIDRKARIELGKDWRGSQDGKAQTVMDEILIPAFKQRRFSKGIVDAMRGLDALARGQDIPVPGVPWGKVLVVVFAIAFVLYRFIRAVGSSAARGRDGSRRRRRRYAGWSRATSRWRQGQMRRDRQWGASFDDDDWSFTDTSGFTGGGGSFGGGSFGGGGGGGGGASGSW